MTQTNLLLSEDGNLVKTAGSKTLEKKTTQFKKTLKSMGYFVNVKKILHAHLMSPVESRGRSQSSANFSIAKHVSSELFELTIHKLRSR